MIFSEGYDRTLWLMVAGNKKDREKIGKVISFISQEIYDEIQLAIINYNNVVNNDIVYDKTFIGKDNFTYYVLVQIVDNQLMLRVRRWIEKKERLEEDYELNLISISLEELKNMELFSNGYIGSYSYEFNKIMINNGLVRVISTENFDREYSVLKGLFKYKVLSFYGYRLFSSRGVNYMRDMPERIYAYNFNTLDKLNRLVRKRKKK